LQVERNVRPTRVAVTHVDAKHMLELPAADDQQTVEALAAGSADAAFLWGAFIRFQPAKLEGCERGT
jgi:hypothetical protein